MNELKSQIQLNKENLRMCIEVFGVNDTCNLVDESTMFYSTDVHQYNILCERIAKHIYMKEITQEILNCIHSCKNDLIIYKVIIDLVKMNIKAKITLDEYIKLLKLVSKNYNFLVISHRDHIKNEDISIIVNECNTIFNSDVDIYTKIKIMNVISIDLTWKNMFHIIEKEDKILNTCVYLYEFYPPDNDINKIITALEFCIYKEENCNIITSIIKKMQLDLTFFEYKYHTFSLFDIFSSVWNFIINNGKGEEMRRILIQKMLKMGDDFINLDNITSILQEFSGDVNLCRYDSVYSQIRNKIYYTLDNALSELVPIVKPEQVIEFIINNLDLNYIYKEYGRVDNYIISTVTSYCSCGVTWSICDGKLCCDADIPIDDQQPVKHKYITDKKVVLPVSNFEFLVSKNSKNDVCVTC